MKTGKALVEEIKNYESGYGSCAFWWLGQLGYIIRSGDTIIAVDPYLNPQGSRLIPPLLEAEDLAMADYILGSHDHGDHIDYHIYSLLRGFPNEVRFVVPDLSVEKLAGRYGGPEELFIGMDEGTVFRDEEKHISITGIASAHEFLDRDPVTGRYPYLGYIIDLNGVRIYHSGDSCIYDGMEAKLRAFTPIDIMFVPINGRDGRKYRSGTIGNMNFAEAVDLCGMLKPALAVPGHYDMFAGNSANPIDFIDFMEAKYPEQTVWLGGHGVKTVYTGA